MYSQAEQLARDEILKFLKSILGKSFKVAKIEINYPPKTEWGNFSVPCFNLVRGKQNPAELAKKIGAKFNKTKFKLINRVHSTGPYLNFFVNIEKFNELVLKQILKEKEKYGQSSLGKGQTVMVEYFSPNTNKPLTVGHLRNICLGESISKILKELGYKVITSCLYNDRGIALCKTIVAYQKWGKVKGPGKVKPDHFAGKFYVLFNKKAAKNKKLDNEAKECLIKWEKNDKLTKALWKKITKWVLAGFNQTLKSIEADDFDKKYYESDYYKKGKDIILQGLKQKIFKKDKEGVIYAPLKKYGLPDKVLLRPNETSLYITQDIYLAKLKNKYKLNKSIYVVGSEQDLYLKQLFKILEMLGWQKVQNYYHLSYGMMRLPEGKIKSREGLVKGTGADELLAQLNKLAEMEVKKRDKKISAKTIKKRAHQIALAALKYYILEVNPRSTMIFDPKKSLAFTGKTGPYLQYVYARISSILRKSKNKNIIKKNKINFSKITEPQEKNLISQLSKFPTIIQAAATNYDPSQLAHYLYDLAKTFSIFYEEVPVLKAKPAVRQARLALITATKIVMKKGLNLLGIKVLEKM
jgi:arginyl-tRNA synthetase